MHKHRRAKPTRPESSPTRNAAIALYAEVINGARIRVPVAPRNRLPELLWVHDTLPGARRTYRLIDSTAPLAERLIRRARLPGWRSLARRLLRVAGDVLH